MHVKPAGERTPLKFLYAAASRTAFALRQNNTVASQG